MITLYSLLAQTEQVRLLEDAVKANQNVEVSGNLAVTWILAVAMLVLIVLVSFKKSKRSHLD
ncbi:MAG: hypothetical protein BIFFINMI_00400 [Phycisphaerae bacterium]|nr:hypothetical protein [Phycisphaerae bacterium]